MIDWPNVKIVWHSDVPDTPNVEQIILEDCERSLWGLDNVSTLIFHTVFLGKDMKNNVVTAWGELVDEHLHCEFESNPIWTSIENE